MLSYMVVLLTMICGAAHAPWWTSLVGGAGLGLLSLSERRYLKPRFAANDNLALANPTAVLVATLHATMGAIAYPIGWVIRALAP